MPDLNKRSFVAPDFAGYEALAWRTVGDLPQNDMELMCGLGIAGEAGEVADLIKKRYFHPHKVVLIDDILEECGDVLWYLAVLTRALDSSLGEVAEKNVQKLEARYPDGFPKGGGA